MTSLKIVNVPTIIICINAPPSLCKREEGMTLTLAPSMTSNKSSLALITLNTNKILVAQIQNIIVVIRA